MQRGRLRHLPLSSLTAKPTKACVPQTEKLEGKTIVTVEGLSDWEKQVYAFAFGEAGAVQCGFCIPGMVISAKALLDVNPDPTREEVGLRHPQQHLPLHRLCEDHRRPSCWRGRSSGRGSCRSLPQR